VKDDDFPAIKTVINAAPILVRSRRNPNDLIKSSTNDISSSKHSGNDNGGVHHKLSLSSSGTDKEQMASLKQDGSPRRKRNDDSHELSSGEEELASRFTSSSRGNYATHEEHDDNDEDIDTGGVGGGGHQHSHDIGDTGRIHLEPWDSYDPINQIYLELGECIDIHICRHELCIPMTMWRDAMFLHPALMFN
jgi:hypothetical protein